jgi:hypothetical protein
MKERILKNLKLNKELPLYMRYGIIEQGDKKNKKYIISETYQTNFYNSKDLYKPILLMKV